MRYTIIIKKVIKEVIGLISIVLFIYTCTKVRASAGYKEAAAHDTLKAGNAIEFGWPVQTRDYDPLLPRHDLPELPDSKKDPVKPPVRLPASSLLSARTRPITVPAFALSVPR